MLFSSIFLWAFTGSSLLLCTLYLEEYSRNHAIGRFVLGSSVYASLTISALMTVLARRFAVPRALGTLIGEQYHDEGLNHLFAGLCVKIGVRKAELHEAKLGNAFSISLARRKLVAVSPSLVQSLEPDETEAVLAHELSHIKNRDSLPKGIARFARLAFPFDPAIRLTEAAIHRERELLADRSSVRVTRKPIALASALIRVHSSPASSIQGLGLGLFIGTQKRGLFSLYPDLRQRIELLLKIASSMKPVPAIPA